MLAADPREDGYTLLIPWPSSRQLSCWRQPTNTSIPVLKRSAGEIAKASCGLPAFLLAASAIPAGPHLKLATIAPEG